MKKTRMMRNDPMTGANWMQRREEKRSEECEMKCKEHTTMKNNNKKRGSTTKRNKIQENDLIKNASTLLIMFIICG